MARLEEPWPVSIARLMSPNAEITLRPRWNAVANMWIHRGDQLFQLFQGQRGAWRIDLWLVIFVLMGWWDDQWNWVGPIPLSTDLWFQFMLCGHASGCCSLPLTAQIPVSLTVWFYCNNWEDVNWHTQTFQIRTTQPSLRPMILWLPSFLLGIRQNEPALGRYFFASSHVW